MLRRVFLTAMFLSGAELRAAVSDYLIVSLVPANDPYHEAAIRLSDIRGGTILPGKIADVEQILPDLQRANPRHVAFVMHPGDFDVNLAHRLLKLATQVDDDPFVDFSYGIITGPARSRSISRCSTATGWRPPRMART